MIRIVEDERDVLPHAKVSTFRYGYYFSLSYRFVLWQRLIAISSSRPPCTCVTETYVLGGQRDPSLGKVELRDVRGTWFLGAPGQGALSCHLIVRALRNTHSLLSFLDFEMARRLLLGAVATGEKMQIAPFGVRDCWHTHPFCDKSHPLVY